jgi:hypothetical protein
MYAALWRALPGNRWAKTAESLVLFAGVVAILFVWVFPAMSTHLPFGNVTVETPSTSPSTPSTGATAR